MPKRFDPALLPPYPTLEFESALWQEGKRVVAGVDEAGRGALAGPIYAAAVVLPAIEDDISQTLFEVRDSKQLSAYEREKLVPLIREAALDFAIAWLEADEIDALGMAQAGRQVFQKALAGLKTTPDHVLVDYFTIPGLDIGQTSLVKGDQRSLSIACASILAKQARDTRMQEEAKRHPGYFLAENKGYGSPDHIKAIQTLGLDDIHRKSFCEGLMQLSLF